MERVFLSVINWRKYNPRTDIKHPTWFALSNRFLEDPDFFDFTGPEKLAVIYVFSQASQKGSPTVELNPAHAKRVCDIDTKVLQVAINKLIDFGHVRLEENPRTQPERERTDSARDTHYIQDTTHTTGQDTTHVESASADPLPRLALIWNEHSGSLSKVKQTNRTRTQKARIRFAEAPEAEWIDTVQRIAQSAFCRGHSNTGWKATFDWLLQPETRLKVLEGKYDDRGPTPGGPDDLAGLRAKYGSEAAS